MAGPALEDFMRAPTDNDRILDYPTSYAREWQRNGLASLQRRLISMDAAAVKPGAVMVRVCSELIGVDPAHPIRCEMRWLATVTGRLELTQDVIIPDAFPMVPRIGLTMTLAPGLREVLWFGRGPWENYCDRKYGAMIGEYRMKIADMLESYMCPGECGGREDVRCLSLLDDAGKAVLSVGGAPHFHFSALHVSRQALAGAGHCWELEARPEIFLQLDGRHMGVGGEDGWSRNVHPEYLIPSGAYRWSVTIALGRGVITC